MKRIFLAVLVIFCFLSIAKTDVFAGEIDVLLDKLVEKDILTPLEASIIKDETKQQVAADLSKEKLYSVPSWVQKIKMKGDLRIRHQYERKTSDTEGRNRGRIRLRLGVDANVIDNVKVGFGLATGGSDPRSTNQTLQNTFDTPDIRLDYAYGEWKPNKDLSVIAGKFKRKPYLWAPTDLLWDGDINPEGGSVHYQGSLTDEVDYWVNGGVWILDDNDQVDRPDPFMEYVQTGLKYKEGGIDGKVAGNYYHFDNIKDIALDNSAGTNTGASTGLQSDYNSLGLSAEVGIKELFGGLPFNLDERIALFGDYILNTDDNVVKEDLAGWAFGVKFGHKKIKNPGSWQVKYIKAVLGKDAWLDTFPDSDRLGGKTDVKSHEIVLNYALKKNVIFGVDYYRSRRWADDGSSSGDIEHIVQADLLLKF